MAKYSLLLVGRNKATIGDFFTHLRDEWECLSCSERFEDIRNHMKYFKPDALVYCLLDDSFEQMQQVLSARSMLEEDNIPLVVIGQEDDCDAFSRYSGGRVELVIDKSSLSILQISTRLKKYLEGCRPVNREESQVVEEPTLLEAMRALDLELPPEIAQEMMQPVKKHILVVDDNPMMLKVIKESLRGKYEVATAISGKIARKYLSNKSVDLILLDYEMPGENGAEVLEKLRQEDSTKNIPVIFLTGVKERAKIQKVLQLKPQGYLLKPIEHDKLIEAIKNQFGEE